MKTSIKHTVISIVLSLLFTCFAWLQLNDPDPFLWFGIYIGVSLFCWVTPFVKLPKLIYTVVIIALAIYAATYFRYLVDWLNTSHKEEIFGKMVYEKPYLEGSREFIGLVMAIAALWYLRKVVKS
ncbi:transmembrane 220 family protein [Ochrovirga pacifica]|uniref:transmembrane 220 family protein n=1 Tax=Ochrovirga pacifica TaxID=1042376 RepID=UPI0002558B46|nr:transmembrane 220 family protein [Ochrovirga pacifica]